MLLLRADWKLYFWTDLLVFFFTCTFSYDYVDVLLFAMFTCLFRKKYERNLLRAFILTNQNSNAHLRRYFYKLKKRGCRSTFHAANFVRGNYVHKIRSKLARNIEVNCQYLFDVMWPAISMILYLRLGWFLTLPWRRKWCWSQCWNQNEMIPGWLT